MPEWIKSLCRFLGRVLGSLPSSIGSNYMGVWFPIVPAFLLVCFQVSQTGWQTVRHDLWVDTVITIISYALLFIYCVARNMYREHRELKNKLRDVSSIVSPLQLDGLRLALEIRTFALSLGEVEGPAPQVEAKHRKAVWEHLHEWIGSYPVETDAQLRARLIHGFEARRFGERVTEYMHRVGETGQPIFNAAGFTQSIYDRRSLYRLAVDIEVIAVTMNLFPKPKEYVDHET